MPEAITIVGGGLAGLTLGIGLRQRDVPVTLWEAGHYPRHRVCGEFISGAGLDSLSRLGLLGGLKELGAIPAGTAAMFSDGRPTVLHALPRPALCVSRLVLDEWLALEFRRLGGELRLDARWLGDCGPGTVRASGRHAEPTADGWRWFGLKAHASGVKPEADVELYLMPSGYVGLCRVGPDTVNVCGLFRVRSAVTDLARHWRDWLGGAPESALHRRMLDANFDEDSFSSVAGLCLRPGRGILSAECRVGDALTLIPPMTGNGMSMAFESAELAVEPIARFHRGERTWEETRREIATACDRRFARRLRWAAWLQWALFQPAARSVLLMAAARSKWLWNHSFNQTR